MLAGCFSERKKADGFTVVRKPRKKANPHDDATDVDHGNADAAIMAKFSVPFRRAACARVRFDLVHTNKPTQTSVSSRLIVAYITPRYGYFLDANDEKYAI